MIEALINPRHEFFRPLVTGWLAKIEAAQRDRKKWDEVADECMMFYSRSAAAMWDDNYSRKFWRNVKAPKFRITINKAFEAVAIYVPNLLWERPHRTVTPKKPLPIPPELFGPEQQQFYQMLMQEQQQKDTVDKTISYLMDCWLNYTPRELDLEGESATALVDALVMGRGCLWTRPHRFPTSTRTLTGSFRESPKDLLIDPDFKSLKHAKWIALKHVDPHWEVEDRFELPRGSLRERASLESSWSYGEYQGNEDKGNPHRAAGQTNDLVVWYEIFSKTGPGARLTGMDQAIKEQLEETVGDFCYLAIAASVPYPLNCQTDSLRRGATEAEVKKKFSWPVPTWADGRWPVEVLDFYTDPESAWPIPLLGPAMGELKLLNFLVPWLANSVWSASRRFWTTLGAHVEHYTKYLSEGEDQVIIPAPTGVQTDDIRKVVAQIESGVINHDIWRILDIVSDLFDKRTGLTEFAYGRNEGGTQDRTAETTLARKQAVGVRPEYMQKRVVSWQSRIAAAEAFLARWFVTGTDVEPLLGKAGRMLWERFIMSTDVELVARQMQYDIAAASIRRPNRDRDIANFQEASSRWLPVLQSYGTESGNYQPVNGLMRKWAEYHDANLEDAMIPEPDEQQQAAQQAAQELQQQQMQAEVVKTQAEAQKLSAEAQANPAELKMVEMQMKMAESQMNIKAKLAELQLKAEMGKQDMALEIAKARAELAMDQQKHQQEMVQKSQEHQLDMTLERQRGAMQIATQRAQSKLQLDTTKKQSDAKVSAIKAQAKAKPKPKASRKAA